MTGEKNDSDVENFSLNFKRLMPWGGGFCFAFFLAWGLSSIFLNSPHPMIYDDAAGFYVHAPGTVQWRSEGWGETFYGKHGALAYQVRALNLDSSKVVLWGDSFVEAAQVNDNQKISVVFNRLRERTDLEMISFGASGYTLENYLQAIPGYENEIPGISKHFIFLAGLSDVRPNNSGKRFASFFTGKANQVLQAQRPGTLSLRFSALVRDWGLNFLPQIFRSLKSFYGRFAKWQLVSRVKGGEKKKESLASVWGDMFFLLKQATEHPVVFVYAPPIPFLKKGSVTFKNSEQRDVDLFQSMCLSNGVGFVDLTKPFGDFYLRTGRFPRGFFNSPPGQGHLNADGQRIVAQTLDAYLLAGVK